MFIGNVDIAAHTLLAPMAGVTDYAFRTLCHSFGPVYTVTEMVSAKALCYGDKKTKRYLKKAGSPSAVQIFGSEVHSMAKGAALAIALSGAEVLDINMGCPTPKIIRNGDGCALMRDPDQAAAIVRAVSEAIKPIPVTVKIRLGWDSGSRNALPFAKQMEEAGVSAVAVHGRTRSQMYGGRADWEAIRDIRQALHIPVIANGDIFSVEDALRCRRITGSELLMIGRGSFGRPWLLRDINLVLQGKEKPRGPSFQEVIEYARRHFALLLADKQERSACLEMRRHLCFYIRGRRDAAKWRTKILTIGSKADFERCLEALEHS